MDCSVGAIVWVRRRNGSWWPGRILGPEELSASHLVSPRSGTPVKLLGREDASVDWYNLEKSKRVKAFRCGEFDACIEKAEASQGIPIKKREKYARREDAILHALELEKHQLEMKHQKLVGTISNDMNNKTLAACRRELNSFPSENYIGNDEPGLHSEFSNHKSQKLSVKAASLHEEEDDLYVHSRTKVKQVGWTEHNPEALPWMRGLQDFGQWIAPPKKYSQATWETSCKPANNHVSLHYNSGHMIENASYGDGNKSSMGIKRKRLQGGSSEVSLVKKRDRCRPLVQVLETNAKLPVSHSFQSGYDSGAIPVQQEMEHMGAMYRAKSNYVYLPVDSNDSLDNDGYPSEQMPVSATQFGTGDYPDQTGALMEEYTSSTTAEETESDTSGSDSSKAEMEEYGLADSTQKLLPGSINCDPPAVHISENFEDLNDDEKTHSAYMPLFRRQDQMMDASADGVSKWHMKGKRNIRQLPKRPMDPIDGKISFSSADKCNGTVKGTTYESRDSSFKMRTEPLSQKAAGRNLYHKEASPCAFRGGDLLEREGHNHLMSYAYQRNSFASQASKDRGRSQKSFNDSDSDSHLLSPSHWEADGPSAHMRRTYWDEADDCYNTVYAGHHSDEMGTMLIDVELKVQAATYQGEHVPLVSLMSRLNGKAIIGHPVQIEILEDGAAGQLVSKYGVDLDEYAPPSAVWRTGRRSVMHRVPRSNPASALEGEDTDPNQDSDPEGMPSPKKAYSGYFNHQAKLAKRSISHALGARKVAEEALERK